MLISFHILSPVVALSRCVPSFDPFSDLLVLSPLRSLPLEFHFPFSPLLFLPFLFSCWKYLICFFKSFLSYNSKVLPLYISLCDFSPYLLADAPLTGISARAISTGCHSSLDGLERRDEGGPACPTSRPE